MHKIPVTDNHIHVDPVNGEGPIEVAKKFHRAGGSFMIIPNKPTWTIGEGCDFQEAMMLVINYVEEINTETDVKAFAVVGAHPAELSRMIKAGVDLQKAESIMKDAIDSAKTLVSDGMAIGIGEVGRPHYEVTPEELETHNRIILHAMTLAKDAGCPVQLHTESSGPEQFQEFAQMADNAGLSRNKVIKHFSGALVNPDETHGIIPSLISTKDVINEAINKGNNFFMETDYLDDKTRPGAVLGPKTVPRRTRELLEKGLLTEEDAHIIHIENIEKTYNINLGW